jgi:PKD repeat protein
MKNFLYLILILPLFIISCEKSPRAQFSTDINDPGVGQTITFHNESENAESFDWDFGDGFVSNETNPVHTYNSTGTFQVMLTAISKRGDEDKASMNITVVVPTLLVIEVREYYQDYVVPDASVLLYNSLSDWNAADASKSEIEGFTDANGIAVFANLDPFVYYVDVWETNHDNSSLGIEDVGFIRTPEVMPHQINWFVALVDKVDHTTTAKGRTSRDFTIKKLVRMPVNRILHPSGGTVGWKALYDRRVNK